MPAKMIGQALLPALEAARAGKLATARSIAAQALEQTGRDPFVLLAASNLAFVCHDYQHALDLAREAGRREPRLGQRALQHVSAFAGAVGWASEAREALEQMIERDPENASLHARAAQLHVRADDIEGALEHAARALKLEDRSPRMRMEVANLLAQIGRNEDAAFSARKAIDIAPRNVPLYAFAGGRFLVAAEAFDEGAAQFERALQIDPEQPDVHVALAELALWRGDTRVGREQARAALELDANHHDARRALAVADMLDGDRAGAGPIFDALIDEDPRDYQSLTWRAEIALRDNDLESAHESLSRAVACADGYLFPVWMLRYLLVFAENDKEAIRPHEVGEFLDAALEICPDAHAAFTARDASQVARVVETALERLKGNRSTMSTYVDESGTLRRVIARSGPRHAARRALQLIRIHPPTQVIERLDETVKHYRTSSLPVCHRGELYLWLGDLRLARADLDEAIALLPQTRWAHIGKTGIDILEGNLERALETCAHGVEIMGNTYGPAVYIYRGEALRRLGRFEEARKDLELVAELTPTRVSAWVNLGLLYHQLGLSDEFETAWQNVIKAIPALVSDAARALEIVVWSDQGPLPSRDDRVRILERSLEMMGGNRSSSCVTYYNGEGQLRFAQPGAGIDSGPNDDDETHLARARAILRKREAMLEPVRAVKRPPWATVKAHEPTTLTPEQVEHFLRRGYVVLPGCFSRETAKEWVDDACRRIREQPQRFVEGYDPTDPQTDLTGFDPEDRSTWTWPRINLLADKALDVAEFSPKLWGGITDLLGGPDRVDRAQISNYFVVAFRPKSAIVTTPAGGGEGWHIDRPSRSTRLSDFRNGLVALVLFSDVGPKGGATYIIPESVGLVSRLLADNPDGVDLVDRTLIPQLTFECEEFLETSGSVGDVLLVHPFMVHCSSSNESGVIRWMINANIAVKEPLNFAREDPSHYSLVERAVVERLSS